MGWAFIASSFSGPNVSVFITFMLHSTWIIKYSFNVYICHWIRPDIAAKGVRSGLVAGWWKQKRRGEMCGPVGGHTSICLQKFHNAFAGHPMFSTKHSPAVCSFQNQTCPCSDPDQPVFQQKQFHHCPCFESKKGRGSHGWQWQCARRTYTDVWDVCTYRPTAWDRTGDRVRPDKGCVHVIYLHPMFTQCSEKLEHAWLLQRASPHLFAGFLWCCHSDRKNYHPTESTSKA